MGRSGWLRPFEVFVRRRNIGWRNRGEEKEAPVPPSWSISVVIGALAMFGEIQAFALGIFGGTQSENLVETKNRIAEPIPDQASVSSTALI